MTEVAAASASSGNTEPGPITPFWHSLVTSAAFDRSAYNARQNVSTPRAASSPASRSCTAVFISSSGYDADTSSSSFTTPCR
jgi:hypothetical protein